MGLGEGVAPSASTDMVSRVIANNRRSQATSYIFGGLHAGSLLGLLIAPPLIERFGWQTVRGLVWAARLPPLGAPAPCLHTHAPILPAASVARSISLSAARALAAAHAAGAPRCSTSLALSAWSGAGGGSSS